MNARYQFLAVVLLLHLPLYAYPILRLCHWLDLDGWLTFTIFMPLDRRLRLFCSMELLLLRLFLATVAAELVFIVTDILSSLI